MSLPSAHCMGQAKTAECFVPMTEEKPGKKCFSTMPVRGPLIWRWTHTIDMYSLPPSGRFDENLGILPAAVQAADSTAQLMAGIIGQKLKAMVFRSACSAGSASVWAPSRIGFMPSLRRKMAAFTVPTMEGQTGIG